MPTDASVLDVGCGVGRHALLLARAGHHVTAVDMNFDRIEALDKSAATDVGSGSVCSVLADGRQDLPFSDGVFDLVLVVHFVAPGIVARLAPLIAAGGYLLLESYGGHGENWRALPAAGQARSELVAQFEVLDLRERPVGPTKREAVSVRFLARRR